MELTVNLISRLMPGWLLYAAVIILPGGSNPPLDRPCNTKTGIDIVYYSHGLPKRAKEIVQPGITKETVWFPDGIVKHRKYFAYGCTTPFFQEEWYGNGRKKSEEYIVGLMCKTDSTFFGFADDSLFCFDVFSKQDTITATYPIPPNGEEQTFHIVVSSNLPLISWYETGVVASRCIRQDSQGVLYVWYSETGHVKNYAYIRNGEVVEELVVQVTQHEDADGKDYHSIVNGDTIFIADFGVLHVDTIYNTDHKSIIFITRGEIHNDDTIIWVYTLVLIDSNTKQQYLFNSSGDDEMMVVMRNPNYFLFDYYSSPAGYTQFLLLDLMDFSLWSTHWLSDNEVFQKEKMGYKDKSYWFTDEYGNDVRHSFQIHNQ